MNRYAFGGGNPLSRIEWGGHWGWSDIGHAVLDAVGVVPVVGEVADLANAVEFRFGLRDQLDYQLGDTIVWAGGARRKPLRRPKGATRTEKATSSARTAGRTSG